VQVLAALFGVGQVDRDVMLRHSLDADPVATFHLQAIDADILDIVIVPIVGIAADDTRFIDKVAAIAAVEAEQRHQIVKIYVVVDHHLLPRRASHALKFARIELVAAGELEELVAQRHVPVHADRERVAGPGAVHIHRHLGAVVAGDIVEMHGGAAFAKFGEGAPRSRQIGFKANRLRNTQEQPFLFENREEFTEILVSPHDMVSSFWRLPASLGHAQLGDLPLPARQHRAGFVQREHDPAGERGIGRHVGARALDFGLKKSQRRLGN
jgi:hypothetical protein